MQNSAKVVLIDTKQAKLANTWDTVPVNGDVVCDDAFVCPDATLEAGEMLDNGKHKLTYQGAVVTWTPAVGDYIIKVTTDAEGDAVTKVPSLLILNEFLIFIGIFFANKGSNVLG